MNPNGNFDKLARRIEQYRDEMVDLQMKLCAIPAIAPSSGGEGEAKKAEFLVEWLKANGFVDITVVKAPDLDAPAGYRPNILAYYRGQSHARTVWVMTHMDVVPPGEVSLWRGDPFKAWVEKGRVYGRGVEDNQQDMVASLVAVKALRAEGIVPAYDIGIALVADEETGSMKGIEHVLKKPQVLPQAGPDHRPRRRRRARDHDRSGREEHSSGSSSRRSASRPTARRPRKASTASRRPAFSSPP